MMEFSFLCKVTLNSFYGNHDTIFQDHLMKKKTAFERESFCNIMNVTFETFK